MPITISGATGGEVGIFKGIVRSVEEDENAALRRWRTTILENDP
jgi:hypothetical protein